MAAVPSRLVGLRLVARAVVWCFYSWSVTEWESWTLIRGVGGVGGERGGREGGEGLGEGRAGCVSLRVPREERVLVLIDRFSNRTLRRLVAQQTYRAL